MHPSTCSTLIIPFIAPFIAALPISALPLTFELRQNYSLPSLVQTIPNVDLNSTNPSLDNWPVHLPLRFPIPNNPSCYLIVPSYIRPEPLPSEDEILNALSSMAQNLTKGKPDQIMNSIALQVGMSKWSLTNERPFDITRETALIVLGAVADIEREYGVASLTNVLFQQYGFFLGSFNFTIATDQASVTPIQDA